MTASYVITLANHDHDADGAIHAKGCADIAKEISRGTAEAYFDIEPAQVAEARRLGFGDLETLGSLVWLQAVDYGDGEVDRTNDIQVQAELANYGIIKVFPCATKVLKSDTDAQRKVRVYAKKVDGLKATREVRQAQLHAFSQLSTDCARKAEASTSFEPEARVFKSESLKFQLKADEAGTEIRKINEDLVRWNFKLETARRAV